MSDPDLRFPEPLLAQPTVDAAKALLGAVVVCVTPEGRAAGRIVETEAYCGPDDPASHSAIYHRAERVQVMAGPVGIAYVYRSYGIHTMLNVAAHADGAVGGVLVRALEPVEGIDLMRLRRGVERDRDLCSGPGKLTQALGIVLADQGTDLMASDRLWLEAGPPPPATAASGRIGISRAVDQPWRFWERDNPHVSAHRRAVEPTPAADPDPTPTNARSQTTP